MTIGRRQGPSGDFQRPDTEIQPQYEASPTGNSTISAQNNLRGASFRLFRETFFNRVQLNITITGNRSIIAFYQQPQGLGGGEYEFVAHALTAPPTIGVVDLIPVQCQGAGAPPCRLVEGIAYVVFGDNQGAGAGETFSSLQVADMTLSNFNIVGAGTHITVWDSTIDASPAIPPGDPTRGGLPEQIRPVLGNNQGIALAPGDYPLTMRLLEV